MGSQSKTDLAYIAGFLDGDGSLMLQLKSRAKENLPHRLMFTICFYQDSRHEKPLSWIRKRLGIGYLTRRNDGITELRINGYVRVRDVMRALLPYLKFKREQAKAMHQASTLLCKRKFLRKLILPPVLSFQAGRYKEASKKADLFEKKERKKIDFIKKGIKKNYKNQEYIKKIHKKLLKSYSKNIKVWIVDGELVRDLFFIEFTEGGHDKVYHFIPKREVWIDDDVSKKEIKFILLHELHERNLMSKGWNYQKAHRDSSRIEFFCRHHKKELNKKLKEELEKSY